MRDLLEENELKKKNRRADIINILLSAIIVLLVVVIVTLLFFLTPMTVSGQSMYPTYDEGDRILLSKVGYTLERGDIVVFKIPDNDNPPIKRIIGMPGDVIFFDLGTMDYTVNGEKLDDFASETGYSAEYFYNADRAVIDALTTTGRTVGENELFVLGDNRNVSKDSHVYGCIDMDWIVGKVILNY